MQHLEWQHAAAPEGADAAGGAAELAYSPRFQDIYRRSEDGGLAQARQVFLQGCGLPQRWLQAFVDADVQGARPKSETFTILECGFGLGTNFLATCLAWDAAQAQGRAYAQLHYIACEAYPVRAADLRRALTLTALASGAAAQALQIVERLSLAFWGLTPGWHHLDLGPIAPKLSLLIGPALALLQDSSIAADAVYLDGFKPKTNADMWSAELMHALRQNSRNGARWATWSVAAALRQNLDQAGVRWAKAPGLPPKRHFLQAWIDNAPASCAVPRPESIELQPTRHRSTVLVIGAGLAGASCAYALAARGLKVHVWERAPGLASGASGIPVGLCAPRVHSSDDAMTQLLRTGLRCTFNVLAQLKALGLLQENSDYAISGVEERHVSDKHLAAAARLAAQDAHYGDWSCASTASCSHSLRHQHAAWIKPVALVRALLQAAAIEVQYEQALEGWAHLEGLLAEQGYAAIVLANGYDARYCSPLPLPYLQAIRGQTSWARHTGATPAAWQQAIPLNGHGYFVPWVPDAHGAFWCAGASYQRGDTQCDIRMTDHQISAEKLRTLAPEYWPSLAPGFAACTAGNHANEALHAHSGIRCYSRGRLPLVGRLDARGVYICTGLASRGLTLATLCGELLALHVLRDSHHPSTSMAGAAAGKPGPTSIACWPLPTALVRKLSP